jgi:hypothetical protein
LASQERLDANHAGRRVDVFPAQREELTASQAGVQRRRPQRPVTLGQGGDQRRSLRRRGDPVTAPFDGRQLETRRRVHGDLAAGQSAAENGPQGHQRVADRACVEALGAEGVGEILEVDPPDLREAVTAERREHAAHERRFVAADCRRLVAVAAPIADRAGLHAPEPRLGRRPQRGRRAGSHGSLPQRYLCLRTPGLRRGRRGSRRGR